MIEGRGRGEEVISDLGTQTTEDAEVEGIGLQNPDGMIWKRMRRGGGGYI